MIIDFHTHTFPDKIAGPAIAKMQADCHSQAFTDGTSGALTASMAQAGIHRSVVLPVATNPAKVCSMNDGVIRSNGEGGLIRFGCMHPDFPDPERELNRLAEAGIQGIKLHPVYQQADLDDSRYLAILRCAARLGLTVVTHAGDDIGFPGVVRCSPEMLRRCADQVPDVMLVLAHMGGWRNWDRVVGCLADTPVYLDTSFSLGAIAPLDDGYYREDQLPLLSAEEFRDLVRAFGANRVLFGTDSPWACQLSSRQAIEALPLSPEEIRAILGGNAETLLGI